MPLAFTTRARRAGADFCAISWLLRRLAHGTTWGLLAAGEPTHA
jgi:hypothetical protein